MAMESSSSSDHLVHDGTVDWKNKPADTGATGGIRASAFVLGELVGDRIAYDGVSASLVTFLTTEMGLPTASASLKVNQWTGTAFLSSIIGGFVADEYLGRYKTILLFSTTYLLVMVLLTLEVSIKKIHPCLMGGKECSNVNTGLFYFAIYTIAVASGASKPCASAFGGDQFDETQERDKLRKASFFNWWFFFQSFGNIIALTLIMAIQQEVGWNWGYGVPTIVLFIGLFLFASAAPLYRYSPLKGSPLTQIARVIVASIRNWRLTTSNECILYEEDDAELSKKGKVKYEHTNQFRCLDKAAIMKGNGKETVQTTSRWMLCSVTEVEEVKLVVRTLPIWFAIIPFSIATAQTHTLFIKQASAMDRRLGTFTIPAGSIAVFQTLTMVLFLPFYDRIFVPIARRFTGHHRGITMLQRMTTGILIGAIAMASAALVERKRLRAKHIDGKLISVFWLLPQYSIIGIALSFTSIGRLEFFYDQAPDSLRSLGTALYLSSVGVANFLSSALIAIVNLTTKGNASGAWIGRTINTSHADYFYWLLAAFCLFDFFLFSALGVWYRYKETIKQQPQHSNNAKDHM